MKLKTGVGDRAGSGVPNRGEDAARQRFVASILGCPLCGRREIAKGLRCCSACRRSLSPTRLSLVLDAVGVAVEQAAEHANVSIRTMRRAVTGQPIGPRSARRIHAAFRSIPIELLRAGDPAHKSLRAK